MIFHKNAEHKHDNVCLLSSDSAQKSENECDGSFNVELESNMQLFSR